MSNVLLHVTHCSEDRKNELCHSTKKPVTTMLTNPWKCTVLHCNHLGNTWKPLVLMTRRFDYCPSASEGDNQSVRSSAPVVSRCFPGGYNVKLYISRGRLAWWLLAFLHSVCSNSSCNSCGAQINMLYMYQRSFETVIAACLLSHLEELSDLMKSLFVPHMNSHELMVLTKQLTENCESLSMWGLHCTG